jgi:hypothetical protein
MVDDLIEVVLHGTGHLILRLLGLRDPEKPKRTRTSGLDEGIFFELEFWVGLFFWVGIVSGAIFLLSRFT